MIKTVTDGSYDLPQANVLSPLINVAQGTSLGSEHNTVPTIKTAITNNFVIFLKN